MAGSRGFDDFPVLQSLPLTSLIDTTGCSEQADATRATVPVSRVRRLLRR